MWIGARSKLTIIPQDPFLFSGTVRDNVDPQHLRSDAEIIDAIQRCRLTQTVDRLGGLDGLVAEGGRMLSSGERQLVCLTRALLSHTQVFSPLLLVFCVFFSITAYRLPQKPCMLHCGAVGWPGRLPIITLYI